MSNPMIYMEIMEKHFATALAEIDAVGDYSIIVPHDDRWEHPLPEMQQHPEQRGPRVLTITITGWTREESFFNHSDKKMHVTTAFGEEENFATFDTTEILGILDSAGNIIYSKTYYIPKIKEKQSKAPPSGKHTLRSLIGEAEPNETSMNAMKKNNPNMFKKE